MKIWFRFLLRFLGCSKKCFCKKCGKITRYDFYVDDKIWEEVSKHIKYGNLLCYECFCSVCDNLGLPTIWKLTEIK